MRQWAGVIRLGGIGDNLIVSAALPGLKKKYGMVEVICRKPFDVVFENNPFVDKLTAWDKDEKLPQGEGWEAWFKHRSKEYAFFQNLSQSVECQLALTRAQSWYWRSDEWRRKFCGKSYLEEVADICGVPYSGLRCGFYPTEEEVFEATATLEKEGVGQHFVAWVISGSRYDKIYPFASIAIHRLIRELGMPVVLLGAPNNDIDIVGMIEAHLKMQGGSHGLDHLHTGISRSWTEENWPIRRVLTMVQCAALVISPDTGPAWAVAFEDMPKIVMLSHASPENITKHWVNTVSLHADPRRVPCWPCHKLIDGPEYCVPNEWNSGASCISDISPDTVLYAAHEAMRPKPLMLEAAE